MAKSKSRSRRTRRRVTNDNSRRMRPTRSNLPDLSPLSRSYSNLFDTPLIDRRYFTPAPRGLESSLVPKHLKHRLVTGSSHAVGVPSSLKYSQPLKVATCVRRKQRKEVLFAVKKTGKRGQKTPRWRAESKLKCK